MKKALESSEVERLRALMAALRQPWATVPTGELKQQRAAAATVIESLLSSLSAANAVVEEARGVVGGLMRILLPVHMNLAQEELGETPAPDDAVLLSFMGSGASDAVTVGEFRGATDTAAAFLARLEPAREKENGDG